VVTLTNEEYEQHRLLVMIEEMQRERRSEREIVAALRDATSHRRPERPARATSPATRRLARWTLARLRA